MREKFPLRHFDFFANKNTFLGSYEHLRFQIKPAGEVFEVTVWHEDVCLEQAVTTETTTFPFSPEGLDLIPNYLAQQYLRPVNK